jgi:outer membrane protein assembly factor BamB
MMGNRVILMAGLAALALEAPARAWQLDFSDVIGSISSGDTLDHTPLAVDPSGDLVAGGPSNRNLLVVKLRAGDGVVLWRLGLGALLYAADFLGVDASGDVLTAGRHSNLAGASGMHKFSGLDGSTLWTAPIADLRLEGDALAFAVDAAGDAMVAGTTVSTFDGQLVKVDGASGAELCRMTDTLTVGFLSLALDGAGDAAVGTEDEFTIVKVSGASCTELWRTTLLGAVPAFTDAVRALATDASGDVIAAGRLSPLANDHDFVVAKLSGATGSELWRTTISGTATGSSDLPLAIAVAPSGDVVSGGWTQNAATGYDLEVVKLAAATGDVLWRSTIDGSLSPEPFFQVEAAVGIALDAAGDVGVAGRTLSTRGGQLSVFKLAGGTGEEIWRRELNGIGPDPQIDGASAITFLEGDAVAVGALEKHGTRMVKIVATTDRLPGRSIRLSERLGDPDSRSLSLLLSSAELVPPSPGGPADLTTVGATLDLFNPVTAETASFSLPAGRWSVSGEAGEALRYLYRDPTRVSGPCTSVKIIARGRTDELGRAAKLRAKCSGSQIAFSLDEPAQGSLGVRFALGGTSMKGWCAVFGGTIVRDFPATAANQGIFQARESPAPSAAECS